MVHKKRVGGYQIQLNYHPGRSITLLFQPSTLSNPHPPGILFFLSFRPLSSLKSPPGLFYNFYKYSLDLFISISFLSHPLPSLLCFYKKQPGSTQLPFISPVWYFTFHLLLCFPGAEPRGGTRGSTKTQDGILYFDHKVHISYKHINITEVLKVQCTYYIY